MFPLTTAEIEASGGADPGKAAADDPMPNHIQNEYHSKYYRGSQLKKQGLANP